MSIEIRDRIKELRRVKASELVADARNWRRHPRAQRSALQAMLERVGYVDAVIARDTPEGLVLVDGHLRADLAADSEIPVVVVDIDEQEAGEVLATLDPLAAMAEPDTDALDALVQGLAERADEALNGLLEEMHGLPGNPKPEEPLAATPEPRVQRGQVWQLGRHRVMCGDSTSAEDVARLLDGAKPRLMVTDPPYGVEYDADWRNREVSGAVGTARRVGAVAQDDRFDWADAAFSLSPAAVFYVWHSSLHVADVQREIRELGFPSSKPIHLTSDTPRNRTALRASLRSWPPPQRPVRLKGSSLSFELRDLGAQTPDGERQEQDVAAIASVDAGHECQRRLDEFAGVEVLGRQDLPHARRRRGGKRNCVVGGRIAHAGRSTGSCDRSDTSS